MSELLVKNEPLYIQLQKKLTGFISEKRPSMLPDERSIADFFKVSRITVRKALSELEHQGIVERIQGRGTLVRKEATAASTDIVALAGMMDEYIRTIFATAVDEASMTGFNLNTLAVNADDSDIAMPSSNSLLNCLVESNKIASLLLLSRISEESIRYLTSKKVPLLTCLFKYKNFDIPAVLDDFHEVMEQLLSSLTAGGIDRIAVAMSHRLKESEDPATGLFANTQSSYLNAAGKTGIPAYPLPSRGTLSINEIMEYFYAMPSAKRPQALITPFVSDTAAASNFLCKHADWKVLLIKNDSPDSRNPHIWTDVHAATRAAIKLAAELAERPDEHFDDIKIPVSFLLPDAAIKKYLSATRRKKS